MEKQYLPQRAEQQERRGMRRVKRCERVSARGTVVY
jgi:hypothetical protein